MDIARGRNRQRLTLIAVAGALLVALAWGVATALAASPSPSGTSDKTVLRIGWTNEPDNLNPFIGWSEPSYEIWYLNYQFLFKDYGVDMKPALDLATAFPTKQNGGVSADGKVWTIHIRSGVRWQDGRPLTAADVAFTYNYIVRNKMAMFTVATDGIRYAEAVDPSTVRIVCSKPKANMETVFLPILPAHIWQKVSPQAAATSFVNGMPIVGSGPFETEQFVRGSYVRMVRNPYYSGKTPAVDEIVFSLYHDPDTLTYDLKSGAIDAAWGLPVAQFASLRAVPGIQTVAYNFLNWGYLNCNGFAGKTTGNPVLRDWRFRQALNYAIDREKLCKVAYDGYARPGTTILPPGEWANPDFHWQPPTSQLYAFDPTKAGELLEQAGYRMGPNGRRLYHGKPIVLRLWATTDDPTAQVAGKLIAGWFDSLGLKVDFSVIDYGALIARLWNYQGKNYAPDFDMYVYDWDGYVDPGETLACETTAQIGGTNEPSWANATYDQLCEQQSSTLDPRARKALIDRMQQLMYEQSPWLVLSYPDHLEAYNTSRWIGWTRVDNGRGPAFYNGAIFSYLNLRPRPAAGATRAGGRDTAALAAVIVVIGALGAVLVVRRRRRVRTVEE